MGIGWTTHVPDVPANIAIAGLIYVPYDQTNTAHKATVKLLTEDGEPYPSAERGQSPEFDFDFEAGRPPGLAKGEEQVMVFAAKLAGLVFTVGAYRFELQIDGEPVETASFHVRQPRVG
jgi:hypothetical protein